MRAAPRARRAAGLPEVVRLIQSLTMHVSDVDVSALADVIQKDAIILAKVLATAQTLGFNATGAPVGSVAQAIHIIGYSRLRSITVGFLITQGAERASEEHRSAAAIAVCSGFVAQAAAHQYAVCDPEEAFVLACLRHFGRIVAASVFPAEYRQALGADRFDESCREQLGLTVLELGRGLLEEEKVPPGVLETVRPWRGPAISREEEQTERVVALCEFSGRLAEACLSRSVGDAEVADLAAEFSGVFPDLPALAAPVLSQAGVQLGRFILDRGISSLPTGALNRFCRRTLVPTSPALESAALLARLLEQFGAQDVAVFARQSDGGESFHLRAGAGPFFRRLPSRLTVRSSERTLAGLCLRRRENILIHAASDPKLAAHLPEWLCGQAGAFALFPALGAAGPKALVLVTWAAPRRIAPPPAFAALLSAVVSAFPAEAN